MRQRSFGELLQRFALSPINDGLRQKREGCIFTECCEQVGVLYNVLPVRIFFLGRTLHICSDGCVLITIWHGEVLCAVSGSTTKPSNQTRHTSEFAFCVGRFLQFEVVVGVVARLNSTTRCRSCRETEFPRSVVGVVVRLSDANIRLILLRCLEPRFHVEAVLSSLKTVYSLPLEGGIWSLARLCLRLGRDQVSEFLYNLLWIVWSWLPKSSACGKH